MATFLTGATGYLGSYLAAELLRHGEPLNLLVRAGSRREARRRLWRALQLHVGFTELEGHLAERVHLFPGDLTAPDLGLAPDAHGRLVETTDSVIHCAASLNRRSERACLNVNVRGTLAVIAAARAAAERGGLRRFTQISTVSVAGERRHETVREDEAVDWRRRDYDAYGRTKKLAEHLVRELLAGVAPVTVLRPSIVLGDSRRPETTQFDMVRAFSFLAALPVLPLRATDRIDVVPANWVARAAVTLHRAESPAHAVYHLSAGEASPAYRELTDAIAAALDGRAPFYAPGLARPASAAAWALERLGPRAVRRAAALFRVFLPYLTYDTVFANERAVPEVGAAPTPFPEWAVPLLEWSRRHRFTYPYTPWPGDAEVPPESVPADPVGSAAS